MSNLRPHQQESIDRIELAQKNMKLLHDHNQDNAAIDQAAVAMKGKMAACRVKGRSGWNDPLLCSAQTLRNMLRDHVEKGDPVDVLNLAMMLFNRGASTKADLIPLDVTVLRDTRDGSWANPGIPDIGEGDWDAWKAWTRDQGLELHVEHLEDEPDDNQAKINYFECESADYSGWQAEAPPADKYGKWHTFSIHDTEDGPCWVFARRHTVPER
jgi:hypothetical protein